MILRLIEFDCTPCIWWEMRRQKLTFNLILSSWQGISGPKKTEFGVSWNWLSREIIQTNSRINTMTEMIEGGRRAVTKNNGIAQITKYILMASVTMFTRYGSVNFFEATGTFELWISESAIHFIIKSSADLIVFMKVVKYCPLTFPPSSSFSLWLSLSLFSTSRRSFTFVWPSKKLTRTNVNSFYYETAT